MKRRRAVVGSAVFFVCGPCVVAGLAPWWITGYRREAGVAGWLGIPLILAGLMVLVDSFRRFAVEGFGTPAPVAPTQQLIVTGWYRYVRNPMYVAVLSTIIGQVLWFGSLPLLGYAAAVWTVFHLFVRYYEEPALRRQFGREYDDYRRAVPRWIPRGRAWRASR